MEAVQTEGCLNCGALLTGAYCASCGQKKVHTDLTMHEFVHEATHELAHWDGKFPSTLKALLLHPGLLTRDFLAGRRARWLPPLRLYVVCSLAYFLSGPFVEAITHRSAREVAKITITDENGKPTVTPAVRRQIEESPLGRIFGTERVIRAAFRPAELNHAIATAYPKAMFVLLPIFALLTSRLWRRTLPHYPAHLYFALHLHAAWFAIFALLTLATIAIPWIGLQLTLAAVVLFYVLMYTVIALRRVFNDSWGRTIAKAAAGGVIYSMCLLVMAAVMFAYAISTM